MKKLLFLLMMLSSMLAKVSAFSVYDISVANADGVTIYYDWIGNKTELAVVGAILSYGDYSGNVVIPGTVEYNGSTYSVTSIGDNAFMNRSDLTSVTIPNSVKSIGEEAFSGCTGLTSVTIPNSVTELGQWAFSGCTGLTYLTISNSVTEIGRGAFMMCTGLTSVTIPNGVTEIGKQAFDGCSGLLSVTIPNSVTYIGEYAFAGCSGLTSLTIPNSVTVIGPNAFIRCHGLTSLTIPSSVNFIFDSAFSGCTGLTSVICQCSPRTIGFDLFSGCSNIQEVTFDCPQIVPLFKNDTSIPKITMTDIVTSIDEWAFDGCSGLSSVTIGDNVTSIGKYAFDGCSGLTSVHISDIAVWYNIEFGNYCSNPLYNAHHLYMNGEEIKNLTIPNSVTEMGKWAFYGCSGLTSLTIPNSVTSIGDNAFNGCSGLTSLTIPNSVTSIGVHAFSDCSGLTSLTIPNSLASISGGAFAGCCSLTSVTIPNSVISIGSAAFARCSSLTSVTIPNSVTSIGSQAFDGCSSLTSVTIPGSVTSIDRYAFQNCTNLQLVRSFITEPFSINKDVFPNNVYRDAMLYIPSNTEKLYSRYDGWREFLKIEEMEAQDDYRPFVEDGKVWKVGGKDSGNPVKFVAYYYFDGDTVIGGKTCKQMMCQRYVSPGYSNDYWAQLPSLSKVGAWYEEDKKVYVCREGTQGMQMLYDFSLEANDTLILNDYQPYYTVGPKQTGGLKGFKGVYRDIMLCGQDIYITTWLEGVGGIDGPLRNVYPETESDPQFLMSCTVGDEVIYLNDEYEDGATPESMDAKKRRFDFNHTVKTQPKTPLRRGEEAALYGEYNEKSLDIRLDPLDEAYLVRITNQKTGETLYEKAINAGSIVALNIDISEYPEGQYEITIDNSNETFNGVIDTTTTGIENLTPTLSKGEGVIFNLNGQRINMLQKGLNIVDGKKIFIK